jgi:hypothetical protein
MKIFITGASGNVGKGIAPLLRAKGHDLVLHDLIQFDTGGLPLIQGDAQFGDGFERGCRGADVVVHLPAWHGIHWNSKTERDFWRLNINGTFELFQAAVATGVKKVVFLSSMAWYGHYDKYGFTKVIGEELCEYYHRNHKIKVARIRPGNFTPWGSFLEYGSRFLGGGVDREDVLDIVVRATEMDTYSNEVFVALRENWLTDAERQKWESSGGAEAPALLESKVPGAAKLIEKYKLDLKHTPEISDTATTKKVLGWSGRHTYLTFLERLKALDAEGGPELVAKQRSSY